MIAVVKRVRKMQALTETAIGKFISNIDEMKTGIRTTKMTAQEEAEAQTGAQGQATEAQTEAQGQATEAQAEAQGQATEAQAEAQGEPLCQEALWPKKS